MHVSAHLDVDVVALQTDDEVHLMLELEAPAAPDTDVERSAHTTVVVLDRSGSMSGDRLDNAKRALVELVAKLDDRDRFGLVTFDDSAQVVIPAGRVGDIGRDRIRRRIQRVETGGMTDLSAGYLRGLQEARRVCTETGATIVLVSDGHANGGITDVGQLQQIAANGGRQSISTSTIGIGHGYDDEILAAIAAHGNGNHAFAADADSAAYAIVQEVDGLLSKTVMVASLLITPSEQVQQISILNDLPAQSVEGGIMVELGDLYAGEKRRLLIKVGAPMIPALGLAQLATLTLTYVALPDLVQQTVTLPVQVNVVPADVAADRVRDPKVIEEALFLAVQRDKRAGLDAMREGDIQQARERIQDGLSKIAGSSSTVLDEERSWLTDTLSSLEDDCPDMGYVTKRTRSDMTRKSRGYKSRLAGGEVILPPEDQHPTEDVTDEPESA